MKSKGTIPFSMELTEKLLYKLGGWQEMKPAKALVSAGAVADVKVDANTIAGMVVSDGRAYKSGLRLLGGSKADNLCTCPRSRREGIICAHSLAVALHALNIPAAAAPPATDAIHPVKELVSNAGYGTKNKHLLRAAADRWPEILEDSTEEEAEPVSLRLILPLSFARGLGAGKPIQVGVEVRVGEGSAPWRLADSLASGASPRKLTPLLPEESALWDCLKRLSPERPPGMLLLKPPALEDILASATGTHCLHLGRETPLFVEAGLYKVPARIPEDAQGFFVTLPSAAAPPLIVGQRAFLLTNSSRLTPLHDTIPSKLWQEWLSHNKTLSWQQVAAFAPVISEAFSFDHPDRIPAIRQIQPNFHFLLSGSLTGLTATISIGKSASTGSQKLPPHDHIPWSPNSPTPPKFLPSDGVFETLCPISQASLAKSLQGWGFSHIHSNQWLIHGEESVALFFAKAFHNLKKWGYVEISSSIKNLSERIDVAHPDIDIEIIQSNNNTDWYSFSCRWLDSGGHELSQRDIRRLLDSGKRSWRKPDGRILVADTDFAEDLLHAVAESGVRLDPAGKGTAGRRQAEFIEATVLRHGHTLHGGTSLATDAAEAYRTAEPVIRQCLAVPPRDYQRTGIGWLIDRLQREGGALLADEMGLGKTLQALAALEYLNAYPLLVVCPASLTTQWNDETKRILPGRKIALISGNNFLQIIDNKCDTNIFITSYRIILEYAPRLKAATYKALLLDEAQTIRNPQSKTRRYLHEFQSSYRIALTGTPVENRPEDIWSLLDWVSPGCMGSRKAFLETYGGTKAQRGGSNQEQAPGVEVSEKRRPSAASLRRLGSRVAPYFLRRLKADVAPELPERTLQVIRCPMTDDQAMLYAQIAQAARSGFSAKTLAAQRIQALTALLRLRQAAVCPDILQEERVTGKSMTASGKWEPLLNILSELRINGRKSLIYSSFKSVISLLSSDFLLQNIPHAVLHGQSTDRESQIRRFKTDQSVSCFLISLKAGGTGLNLPEADTVIHLDPWWNPAVEEQANARVHRIGQHAPVSIFKLVSENTVEEGILSIQDSKIQMAAGILDANSNDTVPEGLTDREIAQLLKLA